MRRLESILVKTFKMFVMSLKCVLFMSIIAFLSQRKLFSPLMSNNVNKSSLTPTARFVHTVLPLFLNIFANKMPVDPLICDKPAGRIGMLRTLVHAITTILGRSCLSVGVVSDEVCRAEDYGRSEALTCSQFVPYNSTCRDAAGARTVLNFIATFIPEWQLLLSPATSDLKLSKGLPIPLKNAGKAVLNSCWEPELRALLVVYKSHGKWDISPECITILPQVCKGVVDKTMNYLFAHLKREHKRDSITSVPGVAGKTRNNPIKIILRLSEFFPALYTMFSDVISQKLIFFFSTKSTYLQTLG